MTYHTKIMLYEVKLLIESDNEDEVKKTLKNLCLNYTDISIAKSRRTEKQNAALHLYFTLLSEALNESGMDMKQFIKVDIQWTPTSVKEQLWKPLQKVLLNKISTKKLNKTEEINLIYDNLNRIIIERTKGEVQVPFPSIEILLDEKEDTKR